jgi:hypothetical protein
MGVSGTAFIIAQAPSSRENSARPPSKLVEFSPISKGSGWTVTQATLSKSVRDGLLRPFSLATRKALRFAAFLK